MGLRKGNQKGYLLDSQGKLDPKAVEIYRYRLKHPGYFFQNVVVIVLFFLAISLIGYVISIMVAILGIVISVLILTLFLRIVIWV